MSKRWGWILAVGFPLLLIGGSPAVVHAATTEQKAQPPAKAEAQKAQAPAATEAQKEQPAAKIEETTEQKAPEAAKAEKTTKESEAAERPAGMVGTVVAYTPSYRTIVVDIPFGPKSDRDTLRLGAQVTDHTKIMMGDKTASTEALKQGDRVRIAYNRVSSGDVATTIHILRPEKG